MRNSDSKLLREIKNIHNRIPAWVLQLILASILLAAAYYLAGLLLLVLIAGIIAYLLTPVVRKMEYLGIKRTVAVATVYMAALTLFISADIVLVPCLQHETKNLAEKLPELTRQAEDAFRDIRDYPYMDELADRIMAGISEPGHLLSRAMNLSDLFSQAASVAFAMVLIPFFVFFILKDWPSVLRGIMHRIPAGYVETSLAALSEIDILAGNYLRGLAIECITVGMMAAFGLWLSGVNYPITLGIITAAANIVPYAGPVASCLAAGLIAFIQFKSIAAVVNVILLYVGIRLLDDFLIQPLTIGRSVKLHPMLLVISIISGQKLFGIMGMILAVPTVTIFQKVVLIILEDRKNRSVKPEPLRHSREIIV